MSIENSFTVASEYDVKQLKSFKFLLCRAVHTIGTYGSPGLMKSINEVNLERYKLVARNIEAASNDIRAGSVAKYAKYLEDAASAGDTKYISEFTPAFIACLNKAVADIDKTIADFYTLYPKPEMDKPDGHLLAKLRDACRNYRIDEIKLLIDELCCYRYKTGNDLIEWLEKNIGLEAYGIVAEGLSKG